MYGNSFRGRGRGRGNRRPTPYSRREPSRTDLTIPRPTPEHLLTGSNCTEKEVAKAKDEARLARDWLTYFEKTFERERYSLPRPTNTHLLPGQEKINSRIDDILTDTKNKCKEVIEDHLKTCIIEAEERMNNPPKSADERMWESLSRRFESYQEASMKNLIDTMTRTMVTLTKAQQPE